VIEIQIETAYHWNQQCILSHVLLWFLSSFFSLSRSFLTPKHIFPIPFFVGLLVGVGREGFESARECADLRPAPHASMDLPPSGKLLPSPSSLYLCVVQEPLPHPSYIGATTASTYEGTGGRSSVWLELQLLTMATAVVAGSSMGAWI
jgi:hypothetical protein